MKMWAVFCEIGLDKKIENDVNPFIIEKLDQTVV
jgi:hypothetical protein